MQAIKIENELDGKDFYLPCLVAIQTYPVKLIDDIQLYKFNLRKGGCDVCGLCIFKHCYKVGI